MVMSATCNIEKLTDTNHRSWKIQMRSVNDLWGVSGEIMLTETNKTEWKVRYRKALVLTKYVTEPDQKVYESKGPV